MRYNPLFINAFKVLYGAKRNNKHFLKECFCDMRNNEGLGKWVPLQELVSSRISQKSNSIIIVLSNIVLETDVKPQKHYFPTSSVGK